jgi:hypothetical protein
MGGFLFGSLNTVPVNMTNKCRYTVQLDTCNAESAANAPSGLRHQGCLEES